MNEKNEKNGQKAMRKTTLCVLLEVPAAMRAIWTRPDAFGRDGAFEYRLLDGLGAEVEAEVGNAIDDGFPGAVGVKPEEAREAVRILSAAFLPRRRARIVEAVLDGEEE